MARNKSKSSRRPSLWDEAEELPRAETKDARWVSRRSRIYRWWLYATIILFPIGMLAAIGAQTAARNARDTANEVASVKTDQADSRAVATAAVEDWLSSAPAPIPGGHLLTWEGAQVSSVAVDDDEATESGVTVEMNSFVVVDANGAQYRVEVSVAIDERGGGLVLSEPSMVPLSGPIADEWADIGTWPGLDSVEVSEDVLAVLEGWVGAYTSGDPRALRLAVGDDDGDHQYQPIVGVHVAMVESTDAATLDPEDPSRIVVRAKVGIAWEQANGKYRDDDGKPINFEEVGINELATFSLDLLVENADTASPVVVAWGGPGSGPTLERYENAVVGERAAQDAYLPGRFSIEESADEGEDAPADDDQGKDGPSSTQAPKKTTTTKTPDTKAPTTTEAEREEGGS